jgi:hypothetical protein
MKLTRGVPDIPPRFNAVATGLSNALSLTVPQSFMVCADEVIE